MKLTSNRQRRILEMLDADQELHIAALADSLEVSQETVRRDLNQLESRGALKRVHGGAVSLSSPRFRPLAERAQVKRLEKDRIAKLAVPLIGAGQTVFLGEGTTVLALAGRLMNAVSARYMTTMIDIAQVLAANKRNEVSLTGGVLDAEHNLLTGHGLIESIETRYFDVVLWGASGIHPELGILDYEESHAALHRALVRRSKRSIVLADHSKFGKGPSICTLALDRIDVVVTDRRPHEGFVEAFREAGVELMTPA
ncbi:MAG: DeoR/GlpR family DNA-binding transcription regulator [Rhodospirillales bacterium]